MTRIEVELISGRKLKQTFDGSFTEVFASLNQLMITNGYLMIAGHLVAAGQIKSLHPIAAEGV
ncbi:hypothetical protein [Liquorilactobacillus vini]|uniref:Uncharacterized protein n=1 Tax=Liquorilactobacillus vini DSM 20605 TaxID=1133569 RepID=A0A0R2C0T8_9LACO|nr:hypothetical protein [Liquorilactobacillus vini]KRM84784.1 hypothetical protein FD21_GL001922 [Liquorilactobacillus vini DSM 20605]